MAGIILRGRGFKVVQMVCVALIGAQGEGPKGPKPCKFQTTVTEEEDMNLLQADLKSLESWQETWKMSFNPAKCSVLKISNKRTPPTREYAFCGQVLQHTTSQPYLGVTLDNKLSWGNHVDNTVAKASRTWDSSGEIFGSVRKK